jgi:hypothetical protein
MRRLALCASALQRARNKQSRHCNNAAGIAGGLAYGAAMRRFIIVTAALVLGLLFDASPAAAAWVWPLQGEILTPYRNGDDPYAAGQHRGIDIAAPVGAGVVAAAAGEIRFAGTAGSSGLTVSVRTADGLDTSYLHLGSIAVRAGERVSAGQRIGVVGTTGVRSVVAPHLHFGVRDAGQRHAYRDPLAFLPPPPTAAPEAPPAAPLPGPVPAAPVVAPGPGGAPAPRQLPTGRRIPGSRPAPAGRRVPAGRRIPAGRRVPAAPGVPAGHPVPAGRPLPVGHRLPAPSPAPADRGAPSARPALRQRPDPMGRAVQAAGDGRLPVNSEGPPELAHEGPGLGEEPAVRSGSPAPGAGSAAGDQHAGTGPAPDSGGGLDLGWALACAALLLAAGILGLNGDGREARRRRGARLAAAIRPLLGRR